MALFPERGGQRVPEEVTEIPEAPEVPDYVEKSGVQPRKTTFSAQVSDDKGKPVIQTPKTKKVAINLPSDQTTLTKQSKGSVGDSLTWFATFWLRALKKAAHFGWKVVGGDKK